jgi:5-methylcytosine-specific restriction endonuclease McrA
MKKLEIKKLDSLWRKAIHERDKVCQMCGNNSDRLNAHHVIGRRNRNVRWDLDNGIGLCPGCHTFKTDSAHQDPLKFMTYFKDEYPERYDHLVMSAYQSNKKVTYEEALETIKKV